MDIMKMNPKEFDKYDKRCNVIKNLILKDYINDKFDFIRNPETLYIEIVINNNSKITLLPDNNWKEIKRHIDKKIIGGAKIEAGQMIGKTGNSGTRPSTLGTKKEAHLHWELILQKVSFTNGVKNLKMFLLVRVILSLQ